VQAQCDVQNDSGKWSMQDCSMNDCEMDALNHTGDDKRIPQENHGEFVLSDRCRIWTLQDLSGRFQWNIQSKNMFINN
jgi:hypothetical protein